MKRPVAKISNYSRRLATFASDVIDHSRRLAKVANLRFALLLVQSKRTLTCYIEVSCHSEAVRSCKKKLQKLQKVALVISGGSRKFWWGGFEAKTSKIRMSSPKLRVVFRPKTELQTFFPPKIRWSPKKKKKKRSSPKLRVIFRPKSELQTFFSHKIRWSPKKKGLHQN